MAGKDKPYKVYRGGRVKGPIRPSEDRPERRSHGDGREAPAAPRTQRRWRRTIVLVLVGLLALALVWTLLGYFAVDRGVDAANERLDGETRQALTPQRGSMLTNASNVLLLGADVGPKWRGREGPGRSDSIMIVRTDPDENRISYLSIPRDLRVEIPGRGADKINAAYSIGGPALAIQTVEHLTGLEVNHVALVDFATFREVIDAVGGITIDNPKPVLSNPFDCPFRGAERCAEFQGWRFRQGEIELDGRRALIYSRIRHNQLDPNESDLTRGERQQRVLQGLADEIVSFRGYVRMPFVGDDIVAPLATDLATHQLFQLGWLRFRASETLRCRLGGTPVSLGGASYLQSSEDNPLVIAMVTGQTAPQRPPEGRPFEPGCFVGRAGA